MTSNIILRNKYTLLAIIITGSLLSVAAVSSKHMTMAQTSKSENQTSKEIRTSNDDKTNLKLALRDLWVDHIVYTRNYIISFAGGLPDVDPVAERLLKNQEDIGNAIKQYYGDAAAKNLTGLLKDHIMGAVEILNAAKADNSTGVSDAEKKWYDNADEIATFLSSANPNWSKEDLKNMLDEHLKLTKSEAVAQLTGKYADGIASFDKVKGQAMKMSDMFADGIIKQFPEKFA